MNKMIKPKALRQAFSAASIDINTCAPGDWELCPLRKLANNLGFERKNSAHGCISAQIDDFMYAVNLIPAGTIGIVTDAWDISIGKGIPKIDALELALTAHEKHTTALNKELKKAAK